MSPEIRTATLMVTANSLNSRPSIPLMNRTGMNTAVRDKVMETIAEHPRGQVEVHGLAGRAEAISAIAATFPQAQVLVLTSTKRRARGLWRGTRDLLGHRMQLAWGHWYRKERCVLAP